MKTAIYFSLFALILVVGSCKEIAPVIGECNTKRVVLIEEFTGVRCVNCPIGTEKIAQLIDQLGEDKLIAVSFHAGYFSQPYTFSAEDFNTADGTDITNWVGPATSYPSACINRTLFPNESSRVIGLSSWAGYIAAELCREPAVTLDLITVYDTTSRQISIIANIASNDQKVVAEQLNLSLLLTESGMVSAQLKDSGIDTFYTHKHVFRAAITNPHGNSFHTGGSKVVNTRLQYTYTLPADQVAENCHIIGFVSYTGANNKFNVLQAAQTNVKN